MFCRLALADDEDQVIAMSRDAVAESTPHLPFNEEKLRLSFRASLTECNPTFFVVEERTGLAGFLEAYICEWNFTDGVYTMPNVTYVRPDKRGSRAAALLMGMFVRWSDKHGAVECAGGNCNNLNTEQWVRFSGKFGFELVGVSMRRMGVTHG